MKCQSLVTTLFTIDVLIRKMRNFVIIGSVPTAARNHQQTYAWESHSNEVVLTRFECICVLTVSEAFDSKKNFYYFPRFPVYR